MNVRITTIVELKSKRGKKGKVTKSIYQIYCFYKQILGLFCDTFLTVSFSTQQRYLVQLFSRSHINLPDVISLLYPFQKRHITEPVVDC